MSTTAEFRVHAPGEFPHGLRCMDCHRLIDVGQPLGSRLDDLMEDGTPSVELVCVYCIGGES